MTWSEYVHNILYNPQVNFIHFTQRESVFEFQNIFLDWSIRKKRTFRLKTMICLSGAMESHNKEEILSCQPRVTVTSCFVYKVIRHLELIDRLCINPIHRIGLIHK